MRKNKYEYYQMKINYFEMGIQNIYTLRFSSIKQNM